MADQDVASRDLRRDAPPDAPERPERGKDQASSVSARPQPQAAPPPEKGHQEKRPLYRRPWIAIPGVIILLTAGVILLIWWLHSRHYVQTDDAFIDAHTVQVSPRVAGQVAQVLIDDNQVVTQGQLLVRLDPTDFDLRIEQAQAAVGQSQGHLEQAKSQLNVAKTAVDQSDAEVKVAQATAANAQSELKRYQAASRGAVSAQAIENAQTAATTAQAQLVAAQKRKVAAEAQVQAAQADIISAQQALRSSQALLDQARTQRSYIEVRASRAGTITRKSVEAGDYVQVGQTLCSIVQPDVWVEANFKETDLQHIRPGMTAEIKIDAFPDRKLHGHVDSIQHGSGAAFSLLPPENATGNYVKIVQRVPVKIVFDEPVDQLKGLGPGMSVVPKVKFR